MPSLTPQQAAAVQAQGNVLLMAGAGTGKTSTLVARCLYWLFEGNPRTSLDRILMVTFTEAAATEMRERLRRALWERSQQAQEQDYAQHQLALLDAAHIRTLHSFNLELVRRHFLDLKIDPQPMVLDASQARLLQEEVLEELWDDYLTQNSDAQKSQVRDWLKSLGPHAEYQASRWILELHQHWRARPNPQGWLDEQLHLLANPAPDDWLKKLPQAFTYWALGWREFLSSLGSEHYADEPNVKQPTIAYAQGFAQLLPKEFSTLDEIISCLQAINQRNDTKKWPPRQATNGRKPIRKFLEEAKALLSYLPQNHSNPLQEDWQIVREWLTPLLELLREFDLRYARAKRQQGALDFNDFEQFALQLLYDKEGKPSSIAQEWRERFDLVLVDEYQDINPAQDAILRALSRDGERANRFLVGDVKQSIYRFREADPKIFQAYARQWPETPNSRVLHLNENFRSCEAILRFVNHFFTGLMIREVGGVQYDQKAHLQFGAPDDRQPLRLQSDGDGTRRVELHLIVADQSSAGGNEVENEEQETESTSENESEKAAVEADKLTIEARLVAHRLKELKDGGYKVWRQDEKKFTAAEWRDMVVLLRGPRGRIPALLDEFKRAGIPLRAEAGSFLESQEVKDLLNLLRLLDNPRQDLPLAAVLRSPLVGLKLDDLAAIRLASQKSSLWIALQRWLTQENTKEPTSSPRARVAEFLAHYRRWRDLARRGSLIACLETILNDTCYDIWCKNQPEGAQRYANVQHLLHLARHFDTLQRQGLHRFLQYVESYRELDLPVESPQTVAENCVRLMSIHQSKGLEFPIVVLANLGAHFNRTQEPVLWEDEFGLCPSVRPPGRTPYPSLIRKLASERIQIENLGEELRLLYVAMTRARDLLILTASAAESKLSRWQKQAGLPITARSIASPQSPLEWVARWWFKNSSGDVLKSAAGQNDWLRWQIHDAQKIAQPQAPSATAATQPSPLAENANSKASQADGPFTQWTSLAELKYPHQPATLEPAKTHVSALRRRAALESEQMAEARILPQAQPFFAPKGAWSDQARGMQAGAAHHLFLERFDLSCPATREHLQEQARLMVAEGDLTEEDIKLLNWDSLVSFWNSDIGRQIQANAAQVQREIPFTARFNAEDLQHAGVPVHKELGKQEFMVVQGIADLVVLLDEELWVLDYKTDHINKEEVPERAKFYAPQVQLYGLALSRIYQRPVRHLWLHFLHPGVTESLTPIGSQIA